MHSTRKNDNQRPTSLIKISINYCQIRPLENFESLRIRVTVSFVRTEEEFLKATSDSKVSLFKIIDENWTLITKKKQSILWNKPTIVGASILELSKLFMLEFHYNVMKKQTDCVLVYSDTDSFIYKLKKPNIFMMT